MAADPFCAVAFVSAAVELAFAGRGAAVMALVPALPLPIGHPKPRHGPVIRMAQPQRHSVHASAITEQQNFVLMGGPFQPSATAGRRRILTMIFSCAGNLACTFPIDGSDKANGEWKANLEKPFGIPFSERP